MKISQIKYLIEKNVCCVIISLAFDRAFISIVPTMSGLYAWHV